MPSGLCLPAADEAERMIGSNGQIQGAMIVTKPARKVKNSSISINLDYRRINSSDTSVKTIKNIPIILVLRNSFDMEIGSMRQLIKA